MLNGHRNRPERLQRNNTDKSLEVTDYEDKGILDVANLNHTLDAGYENVFS